MSTYLTPNRVIQTTFADATATSAAYDSFGRHVSETDQLGRTSTFESDETGRLVAVQLPQVPDPREENGTGPIIDRQPPVQ